MWRYRLRCADSPFPGCRYWGHGNGPLKGNEGSPNLSPWPDLATCFIAFTPCNRFNGGLEVLRGSHRCRQPGAASIEFEVKPWGQAVPTPAGVQFALDQGCEPVYADLDSGDAIFFHCETLHQSGPNTSGKEGVDQPPRWAFLVAYDPSHNATRRIRHPAGYEHPMRESSGASPILDDELVLEYGRAHIEAATSHIAHAAAKQSGAKL